MQNLKKYLKENYINILIIFIYAIITYSLYFNSHYVHDSYRIYANGFWQNLEGFFSQGRPISMWFNMLFSVLHISPYIGQKISILFTIIFLTASTMILYQIIINRLKNTKFNLTNFNKIIILLLSTGIFFNVYITEWMMFFESCIIALGSLLSVISAYYIVEKKNNSKYIFSTIFMIIGIFCYQASISISGAIILIFTIYDNKEKNIFDIAKRIIINMIPYILALICNFAFVKLVNINNVVDTRLSGEVNILYNIFFILRQVKWVIWNMFNFPTKIIIALLILFISIFHIYNVITQKISKINILFIALIPISLYILSMLPIVAMPSNDIYTMPRSVPFLASLLPLLIISILLFTSNIFENKKYIFYVITILYTIIVTISVIKITSECIKNNTQDISIAKTIQYKIDEYEKISNNIVDTITLVPDSKLTINEKNISNFADNTVRAFSASYAVKEIMKFVSNRDYNISNETIDKKIELFGDKEWDTFSLDQLMFSNNILYIVNY